MVSCWVAYRLSPPKGLGVVEAQAELCAQTQAKCRGDEPGPSLLVAGVLDPFSLALVAQGVTLTYVATDRKLARLDGVQYLAGGPCVEAAATSRVVETKHDGPLDEERWQLFAQRSAARGIVSTLTIPITDCEAVIGGVNLYGSRGSTFDGRTQELADLFGGWAAGAITNADLTFSTRLEALKAPAQLDDMHTIDVAVGIIISARAVTADQAQADLEQAAARAGIPLAALARAVIGEHDKGLQTHDDKGLQTHDDKGARE